MNDIERHLELLSIFHFVLGGLEALFACIPIIHVTLGIVMIAGGFGANDAPPEVVGWLFVIIGGLVILLGWTLAILIITAGRRIRQRKSLGFITAIAAIECIIVPIGTVLGVFTLVELSKPEVKALFEG